MTIILIIIIIILAIIIAPIRKKIRYSTSNYIIDNLKLEKFSEEEIDNNQVDFCILHAQYPPRTLMFQSNNCNITNSEWNYEKEPSIIKHQLKGFKTQQPDTVKFCIQNATDPLRSLFYRAEPEDDCVPKWGWGYFDKAVGYGGAYYFYDKEKPGTQKYCYSYSDINNLETLPDKVLVYKAENNECRQIWPFGDSNEVYGIGGEFWA